MSKEFAERCKAEHRCTNCGRQDERTLSGLSRCQACCDKLRARRKKNNMEHKCTSCGKQDERTLAGNSLCNKCIERARAYSRATPASEERKLAGAKRSLDNYYWKRQKHVCTICGQKDSRTLAGACLCNVCVVKKRAYRRIQYRNNTTDADREKSAAYNRERRAKLKAAGLCSKCGKHPADKGFSTCFDCRYESRIRDRDIYAKRHPGRQGNGLARIEWEELGLCRRCGNVLDGQLRKDGTPAKICRRCYEGAKRNGQGTV